MEIRKSNNSSLDDIALLLKNAASVLIFPHMQMDGDALGSAAALCAALRKQGKKAAVLIEDKIPANIKFLDRGYCIPISDFQEWEYDVCIALDCSDWARIEKRQEYFQKGVRTALLDHHTTTQPFADLNYVEPETSSTGEIVFQLLKKMEVVPDADIAEPLYAAIVTDTGNYMYSNTSPETHLVAAELLKTGVDHSRITVEIYQSKRIEKVRITCAILGTMELFHNGKGNIAFMTQQMLTESGAYTEETEGIVEELRSINGVEISAFLKEDEGKVKVTMRAKTHADVSEIARSFGGGGHTKAAGCTIPGDIKDIKELIMEAIDRHLDSLEG